MEKRFYKQKAMLRLILFYLRRLIEFSKPSFFFSYLRPVIKQALYLVGKRRFRQAHNYFWARIFSIEEGLGLAIPLYNFNPELTAHPDRVELEVTTKCSLRCPKCEQAYWDIPKEDMSFNNFKKVIDRFPGLKAVSLTGIGHGFENKEYTKMLAYAKSKSLFVQFFDPLLLINEDISRELIDIGVDWIWMSIDGATKEVYERSIAGSDFDKVVKNATALMELRGKMGSPFPELHFQFIITKYNVNEMPQVVELGNSIIAGRQPLCEIQFIKLISFNENRYLTPEIDKGILRATMEKAKKFKGFRLKFIHVRHGPKPPISECFAWTVPFITVDGTVYPCCTLTEGNIRHLLVKDGALGDRCIAEVQLFTETT